MAKNNDESSALIYMLAGVGLGAIIGAAAGLLFAPKSGNELREDLNDRYKELKGRAEDWVAEQRHKGKELAAEAQQELGV
jgi:gas vesicle protein